MSDAGDFLQATVELAGPDLVTLAVATAGESIEFGKPVRMWEAGRAIGLQLLSRADVDFMRGSTSNELWLRVKSEQTAFSGKTDWRASASLRSDGNVELSFEDGSTATADLNMYDVPAPGKGKPILRDGLTFFGKSDSIYLVGPVIARGGTAVVHRVLSERGSAAAKCLASDRFSIDELLPRFEREIAFVQEVRHRNIIGYLDGAHGGEHSILVMELAATNLADYVAARRLDIEASLLLINQLLAGLACMHECGYVHRDLSPKNVVLDRDGVVKLADFGTVLSGADEDLTTDIADVRLGNIAYISQEQRQDPHSASCADDVFSAGQVAYFLLTGITPIANPPDLASAADPRLPMRAMSVIETMRAHFASDRYPSAVEAHADFRRALS